MSDQTYPMTRVAANALVLATVMLAARLFAYVAGFVEGWRLETDLFALMFVATIVTAVCAIGTLLFGLGLMAQTLSGRAHPRYVSALAAIVVLWFASLLLPSSYRAGMIWSLWAGGVDERRLVDFAAAVRAHVAAPGPPRAVETNLHDLSRQLPQNTHGGLFSRFPPHADVGVTPDRVTISWGGLMVGVHGVAVVDQGSSPAAEPADRSWRYRRLSPRVFTFDYFD